MIPKISVLIPGKLEAIAHAEFIAEHNVQYERLPGYYGGCFCKVKIVDARFEQEVLFVASASLVK